MFQKTKAFAKRNETTLYIIAIGGLSMTAAFYKLKTSLNAFNLNEVSTAVEQLGLSDKVIEQMEKNFMERVTY